MGLLSILKKVKQKEREIRLLILGLDNAGKTTILHKLMGQPLDQIPPTLGFNIETLELDNYKLNIWDVGGQTTIRSYWRNYFEKTDGLIWVVDAADLPRLNDCKLELQKLLHQEKLAGASLLIWANKCDLSNSLSTEKLIDTLGLNQMNLDRHWSIIACSAITGQGLLDGMKWIVGDVGERIYMWS